MKRFPPIVAIAVWIMLSACTPDGPAITPVLAPAASGSTFPRISANGQDGSVVMSWLETTGEGHTLRFAHWQEGGWSAAAAVAQGSDWFVNWADFPSVVPLNDRERAAHWLVKRSDSPYAYDIATAVSADTGESWSAPRLLHDDGTATEHGFVSLIPATGSRSARTRAFWLDGRNMVTDQGGMTLRTATLDAEGRVMNPELIDELVCDCCQTDVAVAASGPVVVYRNRTEDEIRDIHLTRLVDGAWESDRSVADDGWVIGGCPVNGPAIAANGDRIAVTWYTGAGNQPKIRLAFSEDSAASFTAPVDVATGPVMGRVDVVLLTEGTAVVSWIENARTDDGVVAEIRARRVDPDGTLGEDFLIARTGAGRPSGFPQMVAVDDRLLIAWTDTTRETPQVRTATIALR
jgi:hypothetical protein